VQFGDRGGNGGSENGPKLDLVLADIDGNNNDDTCLKK
jgi:hypothetical protein